MYEIETRILVEQPTAIIRGKAGVHEIGPWLGHAYGSVAAELERTGTPIVGPPFARYRVIDEQEFEIEAGFPVAGRISPQGEIEPSILPGGSAAATWHIGPYDAMTPAYQALTRWLDEHRVIARGAPWEVYYSDPDDQPDPATWRTEIIQPYG